MLLFNKAVCCACDFGGKEGKDVNSNVKEISIQPGIQQQFCRRLFLNCSHCLSTWFFDFSI